MPTAPDTVTKTPDGKSIMQKYTEQLTPVLASLAASNVFYVTHKAVYDIRPAKINGNLGGGDATTQSVFEGITPGGVPAQIKLLISGHDHQFQVVNFAGNYAPQLVVGNSGTLLDNNSGTQPQTFTPDATPGSAGAAYALPGVGANTTTTIQSVSNRSEYGFTVMDAIAGGYVANVYNMSSNKLARCVMRLNPRAMSCVQ